MHLVSAYILFVRCFAGVHARELGYINVYAHDLVAILILPNHTSIFEQELSYEERVEMSLCNLSEIIYPFWTR